MFGSSLRAQWIKRIFGSVILLTDVVLHCSSPDSRLTMSLSSLVQLGSYDPDTPAVNLVFLAWMSASHRVRLTERL